MRSSPEGVVRTPEARIAPCSTASSGLPRPARAMGLVARARGAGRYHARMALTVARAPAPHPAGMLRDWLRTHRRVFVLSGAGLSTNSGIPDYRGADGHW